MRPLTRRQRWVLSILAPLDEPVVTLEVSHRYEALVDGIMLPPDHGHVQGHGWRYYTTVYPVLRQLQNKGLVTGGNRANRYGHLSLAVYWELTDEAYERIEEVT